MTLNQTQLLEAILAALGGGDDTGIIVRQGASTIGSDETPWPVLLSDGLGPVGRVDSPLYTSPAAGTSISSGAAASLVVGGAECCPALIEVYNSNNTDLYLHVFNSAALPTVGTVPLRVVRATPKATVSLAFPVRSDAFNLGCVAALSSTDLTFTVAVLPVGIFSALLYPEAS